MLRICDMSDHIENYTRHGQFVKNDNTIKYLMGSRLTFLAIDLVFNIGVELFFDSLL